MRPNAWMKCVAVLLLALGAQRTLSAPHGFPTLRVNPESKTAWVVEESGDDFPTRHFENALDSAQSKEVNEYLDEQRPAKIREWRPTREYVRRQPAGEISKEEAIPPCATLSSDQDYHWKERTPDHPCPARTAAGLCVQRPETMTTPRTKSYRVTSSASRSRQRISKKIQAERDQASGRCSAWNAPDSVKWSWCVCSPESSRF